MTAYVPYSGPEIGKGQFSTVYVGKYFGDLVAVKKQIRTEGVRMHFDIFAYIP